MFPDVPDSHIYRTEIENLAGVQVINGNPNGTFQPDEPVNRAAMLKMLYKASGRIPDLSNVDCFPDVPKGAWFESYVCDAEANRFVQGYSDGTFRPQNNVTRAEAIKLTMLILDIEVPEMTSINRDVLKFVDISTAAWYTKYLSAAFTKGVLPIVGQSGARFYPDWPLLRGEAAAYIYNGLNLKLVEDREDVEEQMQEGQASSAAAIHQPEGTTSSQQSSRALARELNTTFPFTDAQKFEDKASVAYRFTLTSSTVLDATVSLKQGQAGKISCRLYKLAENGFSEEYYLGYQEEQSCYLLTTLTAGNYQLQLEPTTPNTEFTIVTKAGAGDGNDGFSQARGIMRGNLRTEVLSGGDYEDWFSFTVTREAEMVLSIVSSTKLRCLIYPASKIDLFGFAGPVCGAMYLYPVGTYIVGIGHAEPKAAKQTYTIQLK
ncbi:hypothetical protein A3D88_04550 [Candidatus Peribacteria bacterium RIFCSPHIGHO2_02_FULL_52_16]|nr:MAG: hypothetical protein A2706_03180 [Candidatus Peribacteria bacterium RIFCSPHIGHO2_01_FULL_51_35]OGJ60875.1 MAG: hypothetical protein A3D88_04550 [Candidatus Peribacteria bacterium RIFCSPHIGHO2_02_FULL_52_16]